MYLTNRDIYFKAQAHIIVFSSFNLVLKHFTKNIRQYKCTILHSPLTINATELMRMKKKSRKIYRVRSNSIHYDKLKFSLHTFIYNRYSNFLFHTEYLAFFFPSRRIQFGKSDKHSLTHTMHTHLIH